VSNKIIVILLHLVYKCKVCMIQISDFFLSNDHFGNSMASPWWTSMAHIRSIIWIDEHTRCSGSKHPIWASRIKTPDFGCPGTKHPIWASRDKTPTGCFVPGHPVECWVTTDQRIINLYYKNLLSHPWSIFTKYNI